MFSVCEVHSLTLGTRTPVSFQRVKIPRSAPSLFLCPIKYFIRPFLFYIPVNYFPFPLKLQTLTPSPWFRMTHRPHSPCVTPGRGDPRAKHLCKRNQAKGEIVFKSRLLPTSSRPASPSLSLSLSCCSRREPIHPPSSLVQGSPRPPTYSPTDGDGLLLSSPWKPLLIRTCTKARPRESANNAILPPPCLWNRYLWLPWMYLTKFCYFFFC